MILLDRLLSKNKKGKTIPFKKHCIKPDLISENAIHAIKKLQKNKYQAFIVGGAVRDILLGFHPKDFDIVTNAHPEEVKRLFRRQALIIGRRFRIVHVYYKDKNGNKELFEVSTFRADTTDNEEKFGCADEDAKRRDFTINGLFYDPCCGNIVDYVNGVSDIRRQTLSMIGDVDKRLPEDPVRVLRAIRLATKLGLTMNKKLAKRLPHYVPLLADIHNLRLFDEFIKVLKSGAGARILEEWQRHEVPRHVMPILEGNNPFFFSVLAENDRRIAEDRPTSVSFAIASLFWPHIAEHWHRCRNAGDRPLVAMEKALATDVFTQNRIFPQRLIGYAKDLYLLQALMEEPPTRRRTSKVLRNTSFDRALAFATARLDAGAARTASWWSQYTSADKQEKERMVAQVAPPPRSRKKKATKATA